MLWLTRAALINRVGPVRVNAAYYTLYGDVCYVMLCTFCTRKRGARILLTLKAIKQLQQQQYRAELSAQNVGQVAGVRCCRRHRCRATAIHKLEQAHTKSEGERKSERVGTIRNQGGRNREGELYMRPLTLRAAFANYNVCIHAMLARIMCVP